MFYRFYRFLLESSVSPLFAYSRRRRCDGPYDSRRDPLDGLGAGAYCRPLHQMVFAGGCSSRATDAVTTGRLLKEDEGLARFRHSVTA